MSLSTAKNRLFFYSRGLWRGNNFVRTMLRLADEGKNPCGIRSDMTPTSAIELVGILFLMDTDSYGKYHATCEGSTNWYEFALKIFELTGKEVDVEAISARNILLTKRPMYSVLDNKKLKNFMVIE